MGQRLVVSEFPNDNPELHDGLVWACPAPCAPALPTLRLRPSAAGRVLRPSWEPATPASPAVAEIVELEPAPAAVESSETEPEPVVVSESSDESVACGFEAFVAALAGVLAERGATRAAASIGALLGQTRLGRDAFDAETRKTLAARGILDAKTSRPTPEFSVVARAWRDVLDGTGADLSGCGSATLDVFAAELCAALLGVPSGRSDELRRALRQRGVAAFGMLAAA